MSFAFPISALSFFIFAFSTSFGQTSSNNQKDETGKKQGHWIYYGKDRPETKFPDTVKVEEGNYVDDRKEGYWVKYNVDGSVKVEGDYKNNRPKTDCTMYFPNGKVKETSDCNWTNTPEPTPWITTIFTSPKGYIAPEYQLSNYFPVMYIGKYADTLYLTGMNMLYPDSSWLPHLSDKEISKTIIKSSDLSIEFNTANVFYICQPSEFGEDTMIYHSAFSIVLRNKGAEKLLIGEDLKLDITAQYMENGEWKNVEGRHSEFISIKGQLILYPNEIAATAFPMFDSEKRMLRFVIGEVVSEEFYLDPK